MEYPRPRLVSWSRTTSRGSTATLVNAVGKCSMNGLNQVGTGNWIKMA